MVKIRHFLPESSDSASLKVQLIQSGVLDKTSEFSKYILFKMFSGFWNFSKINKILQQKIPKYCIQKEAAIFPPFWL